MTKRGRPRTYRPAIDRGTDQLREKREALVGYGNDPALAENALGILFARNVIDLDQRNAGENFGKLYAKAHGRMGQLGFDPGRGDLDEHALARIEAQYKDCRERLLRHGRRCFDEVTNVCVYRRLPRWAMSYRYARPSWGRDREALIEGLDLLVSLLIGRKAAAE